MPKQDLKKMGFFKEIQEDILENWVHDIQETPHFSEKDFSQKDNLIATSKNLYGQLIKTLENEEIPDVSSDAFKPLFKVWHQVLQGQLQQGFSTKDTALLLFTLKNSLISFFKTKYQNSKFDYSPELNKFNQLLDLLGVLTFEIYTAENENLIRRQQEQIQYLQNQHADQRFEKIIGVSPQIRAVFKAIGLVLENDISILLEGESGTGKDMFANIIHQNSKRQNKPFITVNCGAIPQELIESELFGHEKGSFTDAQEKKIGKFELADGGTIFLDEIGELPLQMQVKILRTLQNKEIERVGGTDKILLDFRVIAATNVNLKNAVDKGLFRLDLFYRLSVFPIHIPALRERQEDILHLAFHFLDHYAEQFGTEKKVLNEDAKSFLLQHPWEGNVRELENMMQRAIILAEKNTITRAVLENHPSDIALLLETTQHTQIIEPTGTKNGIIPLEILERKALQEALGHTQGNIRKASKALGISRTTFYNKMQKYKIPDPKKDTA
ncbi:MAG: transcriptional regulator with PAS, ATPase and Fis domain [Candidatus Marinamargulisbacteria bacterium]|jgi:transcriptional regulator with PAS, ATPase and Fis domain